MTSVESASALLSKRIAGLREHVQGFIFELEPLAAHAQELEAENLGLKTKLRELSQPPEDTSPLPMMREFEESDVTRKSVSFNPAENANASMPGRPDEEESYTHPNETPPAFAAVVPGEVRQMRSFSPSSSSSYSDDKERLQDLVQFSPKPDFASPASSRRASVMERRRSLADVRTTLGLLEDQLSQSVKAGQRDALESRWKNKAELTKERIQMEMALGTHETQAECLYKRSGFCHELLSSTKFEFLTIAVIVLNTIWLGVDMELNTSTMLVDSHWGFVVVENFFAIYFTFEIVLRLGSFVHWSGCLRDKWFLFDAALVILVVFDVWLVTFILAITGSGNSALTDNAAVLRVGRMLRILRTARMSRLLFMIPELVILVKGMLVALRSVFFTLMLLFMLTYGFAICFTQAAKDTELEKTYFSDVGSSMSTLVLDIILPDKKPIVSALAAVHWTYTFGSLIYILLGSLTIMNMLLGILVDVVTTVSGAETELNEIDFARRTLLNLIHDTSADVDNDNRISRDEFMALVAKPEAIRALSSLGVDALGAVDLLDVMFESEEAMPFAVFMHNMLMLRGSNVATVKDIVDIRKFIALEFSILYESLPSSSIKPQSANGSHRPEVMGSASTRSNNKGLARASSKRLGGTGLYVPK